MKLYARTLLFFVGTVVFQSILTIVLITGLVIQDNQREAEKEIHYEAIYAYDSYNLWVRGLWKDIFQIKNDPHLLKSVSLYSSGYSDDLYSTLKEYVDSSGLDAVALIPSTMDHIAIIKTKESTISSQSLQDYTFTRPHPYIELRMIDSDVYLTASFRFNTKDSMRMILLKKISSDFYTDMVSNDRSILFFSTDKAAAQKKLKEAGFIDDLLKGFHGDVPYREVMGLTIGGSTYNTSVRAIGQIHGSHGTEPLYLILLMSNRPYEQLLLRIREIVIYVSLLAGILTIILSIFFSKKIARSFNKLIAAMSRVREGDFSVHVPDDSAREVQRLINGFNEMAAQLNNNKKTMDTYIGEITFLKDYNEKIFHSLNTGLLVVNSDFSIEKVNSSVLEHFGFIGKTIVGASVKELHTSILDTTAFKMIEEITSGKRDFWTEIKRTEKQVFEIKLYSLYTVPEGERGKCVIEIADISRKVELDEKIMQAEKLASISLLSAGVSHEINNPLGSILTNVQNLIVEEEDKGKKRSLIWIEQETKRIARIVRELLDFSSSDNQTDEGAEVNRCVRDMVSIIEYGMREKNRINFHLDLEEGLPYAAIASDELKQILINLIQNSIQAIAGDGLITIRSRADESFEKVQMEITDTGKGMKPEIIPHIFDPFYTTKRNGEGTGLGLSITYGIISKYAGTIDVQSKEDVGTSIKLSLPVKED